MSRKITEAEQAAIRAFYLSGRKPQIIPPAPRPARQQSGGDYLSLGSLAIAAFAAMRARPAE